MTKGGLNRIAQHQARTFIDGPAKELKKLTRVHKEPKNTLWNFSLRYWSQQDYFGLSGNGIGNQWLVSVFARLKQLSSEPIERAFRDPAMRDQMRFHPINWQSPKIPISIADLMELPSYCKDNPEFELHQFQVSTGKGRIVGFFDENWVFNIVLLDPLHNLQPSKDFAYAVNPCKPLSCEITALREGIRKSISLCRVSDCQAAKEVSSLADGQDIFLEEFAILMVKLKDTSSLSWAKELVSDGRVESLAEIFEQGLIKLADANYSVTNQ